MITVAAHHTIKNISNFSKAFEKILFAVVFPWPDEKQQQHEHTTMIHSTRSIDSQENNTKLHRHSFHTVQLQRLDEQNNNYIEKFIYIVVTHT